MHSLLLQANPELDYLHNHIWKRIEKGNTPKLQIDEMVIELLDRVMSILTHTASVPVVTDSLKQYHLATVENARAYILDNFSNNISLQQIARHCLVSPFHFSRIFKTIMNISPHQYLTGVRLNHAKVLMTTSDLSVTDVAFACGFNSLEHFVTAYRQRFKVSPSTHRHQRS